MSYEFATLSPQPPEGWEFKNHTRKTSVIITKQLLEAITDLSAEGWLVVHFKESPQAKLLQIVWLQRAVINL